VHGNAPPGPLRVHHPFKKRGGLKSRRKGSRNELALVRFLQDKGFAAEKTSRTGYTGTDISMPLLGVDRRVEVKARANGFRELYRWLAENDLLIVRADRKEPLVVIPLWLAAEVAAVAEGHKPMPAPAERAHPSPTGTPRHNGDGWQGSATKI